MRNFNKISGIPVLCLLLGSCGLFQEYPEELLSAHRQAYKVVRITQDNADAIIRNMAHKQKLMAFYYLERYYLEKIEAAQTVEEKSRLKTEKETQMEAAAKLIKEYADQQREVLKGNFEVGKKLMQEVHDFMSIRPLKLEDLKLIVEETKDLIERIRAD